MLPIAGVDKVDGSDKRVRRCGRSSRAEDRYLRVRDCKEKLSDPTQARDRSGQACVQDRSTIVRDAIVVRVDQADQFANRRKHAGSRSGRTAGSNQQRAVVQKLHALGKIQARGKTSDAEQTAVYPRVGANLNIGGYGRHLRNGEGSYGCGTRQAAQECLGFDGGGCRNVQRRGV